MSFFRFTSDFIYWTQINQSDHEKIKNDLLPKIRENEKIQDTKSYIKHTDSDSSFITNYSEDDSRYLLQNTTLFNFIWKSFDDMLQKHNNNQEYRNIELHKSVISDVWYTSYKKNSYFPSHNHHDTMCITIDNENYYSTFSAIYILHDLNDKNSTTFTKYDNLFTHKLQQTYYTCDNDEIKEGTLLLFPSRLIHNVNIPEIEGRVTLAYNIHSVY